MKKLLLLTAHCLLLTAYSANAQPGANDPTFNPGTGVDGQVRSTSIQSDGKIIIVGTFNSYNGTARRNLARLNADGTLDLSFNPGTGANSHVFTTAIQSDGKVIIGGNFNSYNGTPINRIARLNADGTLDLSFNPGTGANSQVWTISIQSDGKIIIGGALTSYNGTSRKRIARLNANGTLDTGFHPAGGANNQIQTISIQSDGKVIIGGHFTTYHSTLINRIARLNANGTIDLSFNPGFGSNNVTQTIAIQSDGKIIIGGQFTSYNGTPINRIARLNADGTLDTGFNPGAGANWSVSTIAIQSDGKVIIGGDFTSYNGTPINRIARLNADGTLDTGFNPGTGVNNAVMTTSIQSDGKIIIGGGFPTYNGTARNRVARVLVGTPPVVFTWDGSSSTDWNTAANWSTNAVPTATDDVTIPNVANDPVMSTSQLIKDVVLEAGATLQVASGGTLTLDGELDNSGAVTIQSGGSFLQGASSSLTGAGTFSVQRQGNAGQQFNFWSSPITAQNGVPGTSYEYVSSGSTQDESDDANDPGWSAFNGTMTPGVGYAGQGGGLATFTGTPNNGTIPVNGLHAATYDGTFTSTTGGSPFNLVGNPYPSAISANSFITANTSKIEGTVYFWIDDNSGGTGYNRTDYATWNGAGALGSSPGSQGAPNGNIAAAQGFLVRVRDAATAPYNISFTNAMRVAGNNGQFFRTNAERSRLWFSVETQDNFDQILVALMDDATEDEDDLYDAVKLNAPNSISIAAMGNGLQHAIQAMPHSEIDRTVPLKVEVAEAGTYNFTAATMENFDGYNVSFVDVVNQLDIPLTEGDAIPVTLQAGEYINRFYLNFSPRTTTGIEEESTNSMNAWMNNDRLFIQLSTEATDATVQVFDMNGRVVADLQPTNVAVGMFSIPLTVAQGIYTVRVISESLIQTQKVYKAN